MSKSAKQPPAASSAASVAPATTARPRAENPKAKKAEPNSKQTRVIAMLQSPAGATIAAMMKATGWQQHSVPGFLTGVVRQRLKLKLGSRKVDGSRIYRITGGGGAKSGASHSKPGSS